MVLLRGINVGGKNSVPMAALRDMLSSLGYDEVTSNIASGNVMVSSGKTPTAIAQEIEKELPKHFTLDSKLIRVLVLNHEQLKDIIDSKPAGFGEQPSTYHSDVIFLIGITAKDAIKIFNPREGVDRVWPGDGVIYSERLSVERTKSRLGTIIGTPLYQSMTIRSWNTVTKLLTLF